jgi:hypothetical protein
MTDLAMHPATVLTRPGAEYADDRRLWQGIPGLARAPRGRLWACWYSGGKTEEPGNYVVVATSGDDGATWTCPRVIILPPDPRVRCYDPVPWVDPRGRLWLFWAQSESFFDGRAGVWTTVCEAPDDADPAWSAPRRVANGVMMNKPTVLADGTWLLPTAVWAHPDHRRPALEGEYLSNVTASTDEGATWTRRGGADVPQRWFDEHMVVERRDGTLWMLVRAAGGVRQAVSADGGATWQALDGVALPGPNARFFIRRLRSGRLLLVNHEPAGGWSRVTGNVDAAITARNNLTAMLSDDDGRTWIGGLTLDARDGVSYPDGVEADDGTLYVIYDRERYAAREILMAVFTEADILAGTPAPQTRLRVVVNTATGAA